MDLDTLYSLIGSEARARIIACFVANPEARRDVATLASVTGIGPRTLRPELARLTEVGLLRRERDGRRAVYARSGYGPEWRHTENMFATYGIPLLLQIALADVPGVEAAFIFGSLARGDARPDSDVDLLIYGNEVAGADLGRATLDAALALGRQIDLKEYNADEFRHDNDPGVSFLPTALSGPKVWLVGSPARLPLDQRRAA